MNKVAVFVSNSVTVNANSIYEAELLHMDRLRRGGIPMAGRMLHNGVVSGTLSFTDNEEGRTYVWTPKAPECEKPKGWLNRLRKIFKHEYRINRFENLIGEWYQVCEKTWYWPFWTWFATRIPGYHQIPTRYETISEARDAIKYRMGGYKRKPSHSVVENYSSG